MPQKVRQCIGAAGAVIVHLCITDIALPLPSHQAVVEPMDEAAQPELAPRPLLYCERFVELIIDLLSQLPTRRFVRTLLDDRQLLVKCRMAQLYRHPVGRVLGLG